MKKIGIGIVGYGGIGKVHVLAYRTIPYHYDLAPNVFNIVGVATSNAKTAEKAAAQISCDFWSDNYRELINRDDIDIIHCCVPNNMHKEIVLAAADAGKHIYCEKPLAMNVAEAQEMTRTASRANIKTQVTYNFRFFPAITRARQLVDEGFLGRVFSFRGKYYRSSYINYDKPLSWRLKKETSGAGALFDIGSHVIDLIYYLLGETESVQAVLETLIRERPVSASSKEKGIVDVDDIAFIHMKMSNGALGVIETSRMGTGATNDLEIEIYGDLGAIRFNATNPSWLEVYDTRDPSDQLGGMRGFRKLETVQRFDGQKVPDWSMPPSFLRTHAESQYQFIKAVTEDLPAAPTFTDGLHVQQIMQAAIESSGEGGWVSLDKFKGANP